MVCRRSWRQPIVGYNSTDATSWRGISDNSLGKPIGATNPITDRRTNSKSDGNPYRKSDKKTIAFANKLAFNISNVYSYACANSNPVYIADSTTNAVAYPESNKPAYFTTFFIANTTTYSDPDFWTN